MIKTLIVTGGSVSEDFLKDVLYKNEFNNIIASDKGLEVLDKQNIKPNYIIGDFDSIDKKILGKYLNDKSISITKLNPEKDYTDTHMALKLAIEIKSKDITIIGAIGSRLDHTFANINILKEALDKNIPCRIINENNEIYLINKNNILKKDELFPYISLIPLTSSVEGVTLKGFKYLLDNDIMNIGKSIGVSNEQLEDVASIDIKKGILVVIKSKD